MASLGLSLLSTPQKETLSELSPQGKVKVWAVGGGKGGVGKSLFTANISICLSLMGHRVIGIDLDLGGANLHTCLGCPIPDRTLSDYLNKKLPNLNELVTQTSIDNLGLISGAQDHVGITNLKQVEKSRLLSKLHELDADYVILDLGAGTSINTLDFFISANQGILVTLPEPTSIENTYRFIKSVYHRKLKMTEDFLEIGPLIDQVVNAKLADRSTPSQLVEKIVTFNPDMGSKLKAEIGKFCPKLVLNQVRTQTDIDIGPSMRIICRKYFGIDLGFLGHLEYDATVWQSVKKRRPLLMEFPNSALVSNFDRIIKNLLDI